MDVLVAHLVYVHEIAVCLACIINVSFSIISLS